MLRTTLTATTLTAVAIGILQLVPSARDIMPTVEQTAAYCASADPETERPEVYALCDDLAHRVIPCSTDSECEALNPAIARKLDHYAY